MNSTLIHSLAAQGRELPPLRNRVGDAPSPSSTPGGGKSVEQLIRETNRWRDTYNPLRALTIARVVAMIEAGERGDFAELQWTQRKVEKRYPILKGLKTRWETALEEMDWDIKTIDPKKLPAGVTEEMVNAQAQFLRSRYELIENLTETFGFLALADFRGFAILQKHRHEGGENDGAVRELHWLPQWNWTRDGLFGDWFYNRDFRFGATPESLGEDNRIGSERLPRAEFIIRESDAPLYEIALIAFVNWAMGRKDWSAFVEIFGLAKGVAIMPPNIPPGKEDEYRSAAEKVSDGVAGALPNGADIKFPTASVRGEAPFKSFCDAQDADVVMAGTGGRLTMLTAERGGLGDGPSAEQDDAFKKVGRAVARKINQTLQRDFDRLELAAEFPGQPVLAYFELASTEEEDAQAVITIASTAHGMGLQADAEELSDKTGLKLTRVEQEEPDPNDLEAEDDAPSPAGQGRDEGGRLSNRKSRIRNRQSPEESFYAALADKVDPIGQLLKRLSEIKDDAQMLAAFQQFLNHADRLGALVATDVTRLQTALQQITQPKLSQGLAGK